MRFLKGLGLFVAIACLVWVGVLWRWQATQRDMSIDDILIYLGALPVTLFALVLVGKWAWHGVSARMDEQQRQAASAKADGAGAVAADTASSAERYATVQLLAAHASCGAGESLDEILDASEAGQPRPDIDAEFHNDQGLPVFTARVKDLAVDDVTAALAQIAERHTQATDGINPTQFASSDSFIRSLALLEPHLADAVLALANWSSRFNPPQSPTPTTHAAQMPSRVRVLTAWPADTPAPLMQLADVWLTEQLQAHGEGIVPAASWSLNPGNACTGPELWLQADRMLTSLEREQIPDVVMLVACHSDIDANAVSRLEQAGALFSPKRPKGVIPGEGAAVLLFAGATWPAADDADADKPSAPHLHRAAAARRDKSADDAGRIGTELASELLRQSLDAARLQAGDVAGITNDADQHRACSTELHASMRDHLPQLDAVEDQRMLGHVAGRLGAVATLMSVAMASRRAVSTSKPWAALSVADSHWRLALVARPEAPPAAPAPSSDLAAKPAAANTETA